MTPIWRIRLCEGLTLEDASGRLVHRFRSQKAAALLAYLALHHGRPCGRESLCNILWPDEETTIARTRLRITLASLRRQLEPPGVPAGTVLETLGNDRLRLRPDGTITDLAEIEAALARGDTAAARRIARGELLPTFFDEWAVEARHRFAALRDQMESGDSAPLLPPAAEIEASPRFDRSLPVYLTRFFGRAEERARIIQLLAAPDVRLMTLTGGGGHGKTRLAVEIAHAYTSGPVWFAALADLWDGGQLSFALLRALDLTALPALEPLEQIAAFFTAYAAPLLVLDNMEQIVQRAAPVIASLLAVASNLTILATSRSRLELPGEHSVPLAPLAPEGEAAALFVDRAQSVLPDFQQTPRNTDHIAAICRLLDGIPLGIELAAAHIGSHTVAKMHTQLESHWNALPAARPGQKEARHRSLRAAIEWSVALLPPDQKRLFIGLSAFRGGATLEAIEAVCDAPFALDTLTRLRAASLVGAHEEAGDLRFTVLEVLRQWASESLPPEVTERHTRYFADCASASFPDEPAQLAWIGREYGNIQKALEHVRESRDIPEIVALLGSLGTYWLRGGHLREARECFVELLPIIRSAQTESITDSLAEGLFDTIANAAVIAQVIGEYEEAEALWMEAIPLAKARNDGPRQARALATLGAVRDNRGDFDGSITLNQQALAIARACDDLRGQTRALLFLISAYEFHQEIALWEQCTREGLEIAQRMDDWHIGSFTMELGLISLARNNLADARIHLTDALQIMNRIGDRSRLHYVLESVASLNEREGDTRTAVLLLATASRLRESIGYPVTDTYRAKLDRLVTRLKASLNASAFADTWRQGEQLPLSEAIARALAPKDNSPA